MGVIDSNAQVLYFYLPTYKREKIMYLSYYDITAIVIALGTSLVLLVIMLYANIQLLKENRFLRDRLKAWRRKSIQNQGE